MESAASEVGSGDIQPAIASQIESVAFHRAQLNSERTRIVVVLVAVLTTLLLQTIRMFILHAHEDRAHLLAKIVFVTLFLLYELFMLRMVARALQRSTELSPALWVSDIIIETSLPALGMAALASTAIAPAYRTLANPLALTFFLFIILSVLRLNPWASILSGTVAAISYLSASVYLGWSPLLRTHASITSPERTVFSYALEFLVAGGVATAVARELRKYVNAALREAENKRKMERLQHDMKLARSIQQSLLPRETPAVDGFELAGCNFPADETGGDFYDWQVLPSGELVVVLADVTGHGLGPAMLATGCRAYARASLSVEDGLLTALTRINAALAQDLTPGRFATLVAAKCAPGSSRVELLSAGHGPLFIYLLREDRLKSMGAQGLPLGIMPVFSSEPSQFLDLQPGDLLILATDGLYEWENAQGEQFGPERVENLIRKFRDCSPQKILVALCDGVRAFSNGISQQDDLTAVVIKRI